ncbi:IS3 family transposase [uncultured Lactobacillus sp.]
MRDQRPHEYHNRKRIKIKLKGLAPIKYRQLVRS